MVGKYKLIDKLKDAFIVETEDEVFYDADISDNGTKNTFISNIEKQMKKEEIKILRSLNYTDADSFVDYLEKDMFHVFLFYKKHKLDKIQIFQCDAKEVATMYDCIDGVLKNEKIF